MRSAMSAGQRFLALFPAGTTLRKARITGERELVKVKIAEARNPGQGSTIGLPPVTARHIGLARFKRNAVNDDAGP